MILGAQMYTLRRFMQSERDMEYSLAKVAQMGYTCVQISGGGAIEPKKLREICDKNGLKIVLTHTDPERILNDTGRVIEEHDILGADYIGIGAMPERYRDPKFLFRFAEDFGPAARRIKSAGKLLTYHNHNFEFERINGKRVIETLLESFKPDEMGFTLDTYWVQAAGADVLYWLDVLQDRIPCVHLKDMDVRGFQQIMAPVMEGNMNFQAILWKLAEMGGTKYLLVEQDECEGSPFDCLKKSYDNVSAFLEN